MRACLPRGTAVAHLPLLFRRIEDAEIAEWSARFGGEEFVVLMPATDLAQAVVIAERIREAFASCPVAPLADPATASFGVAALVAGQHGPLLLQRADRALYAAKQAGRNRVTAG